jgi:hypothetical protein
MNWKQDRYKQLLEVFSSNNKSFDIFSKGFLRDIDENTYSYPTISTGLQLLIKPSSNINNHSNLWTIFSGLDMEIWLLIAFTPVLIGFFAVLFENNLTSLNFDVLFMLKEMVWQGVSSIFFGSDIQLQKLSERLLFLTFWFITFIVGFYYIGNITIKLNYEHENINSSKRIFFLGKIRILAETK